MHLIRQIITGGLLLSTLFVCSCKGRTYRASSGSMEGTLPMGTEFVVLPSSKFERNEIAVFDILSEDFRSPIGESGNYKMHLEKKVFRVIAFSGDSLWIKEGEVFVNNKHVPQPELGKMEYELVSTKPLVELNDKDSYNTSYLSKIDGDYVCKVSLTTKEAEEYRKNAVVKTVTRSLFTHNVADTSLAKPGPDYQWSVDYYGPLRIPAPGETIVVTVENYKMYQHIPEIRLGKNIIKEKLYFLLGDNRHFAADCRFSGFISHSKMSGVVK